MSNPQSRNEAILQNILGEDNTLTPPQSRVEELLQAILTHGEYDKEPQSRNEELLLDMLDEVDTKLIPENIKKDVEIFGTVGTLEGGSSIDVEALSVDANGTYTAPTGKAYSPVTVDVEPDLTTKSITENGTYNASSDNADGYSSVTVDVDPDLMAKSITQNGTYTAAADNVDGYSEVTVNVSGGGGQEVPEKDVNFIDYDGTVLYSYTAQEALALTALPANPSHEGLTAQGWNYTLAEVKTEVNSVGGATVGQMYVTDDGKTRIYFHLYEGRLEPGLVLYISGTVEVDWGDGSPTETFTSTILGYRHKYASAGDYVIAIKVVSGEASLYTSASNCQILKDYVSDYSAVYRNAITKVEIGNSMGIKPSTFASCYSIESVTIPASQNITTIDSNAFKNCYSLKSVVVPNRVTSIASNAFYYNYALKQCSLPPSITSIGDSALSYCTSLRRLIIPTGTTTLGAALAQYDYALEELLMADSVTSYSSTPVYSNTSLHKYRISSGLTNFGGISSATAMGVLRVPDCDVDTYGMSFNNNYGMYEYHFEATTPQALASNGFGNIAADCKIYVPSASLATYKAATNWSAYAGKIVGE